MPEDRFGGGSDGIGKKFDPQLATTFVYLVLHLTWHQLNYGP